MFSKFYTLLCGLAVFALLGAGLILSQQFSPIAPTVTIPAAVGSVVNTMIVGTTPTAGSLCGSYNIADFNWSTGELSFCINGAWQKQPQQIVTGAASADGAVLVTLASGAGSYTLAGTYLTAPVCQATDTTAANAVKASASTTAVTLAGTSTDVIALSCAKRT
jgi:hypothetical protein